MKKTHRFLTALLSISVAAVLSLALYMQSTLPDVFYVVSGEELVINISPAVTVSGASSTDALTASLGGGKSYTSQLRLFHSIGIKPVQVRVVERKMVVPCGTPFGIKMYTDGVMVVGLSDIDTGESLVNPAKDAGIQTGDIILEIDGVKITPDKNVGEIVSKSGGKALSVKIKRASSIYTLNLKAAYSKVEEKYRAGVWLRDSSAGIGTMTYYDPATGVFGGLGHAVCDVDTGEIMPLSSGEILEANITGVSKGYSGTPGELKGIFLNANVLGQLSINNETGVFGRLSGKPQADVEMPLAYKNEISEGAASILATVSGNTAQEYDILIERINYNDSNPTKNMVIKIVDPELIRATGGIVQGMSGSPILQNGSLVGAVTHVFVNDPTRGYGIFAENMDKTSQIAAQNVKKAS